MLQQLTPPDNRHPPAPAPLPTHSIIQQNTSENNELQKGVELRL